MSTKTAPHATPETEQSATYEIGFIKMSKVLILNDDVSTFEFVMEVLISIFNKSANDAQKLTIEIHKTGAGLAGVYSNEVAELKVEQATSLARGRNYPLMIVMEPA